MCSLDDPFREMFLRLDEQTTPLPPTNGDADWHLVVTPSGPSRKKAGIEEDAHNRRVSRGSAQAHARVVATQSPRHSDASRVVLVAWSGGCGVGRGAGERARRRVGTRASAGSHCGGEALLKTGEHGENQFLRLIL